jgi:hypothetical protein
MAVRNNGQQSVLVRRLRCALGVSVPLGAIDLAIFIFIGCAKNAWPGLALIRSGDAFETGSASRQKALRKFVLRQNAVLILVVLLD